MMVSTASTWQKNGRSLSNFSDRQCLSNSRVMYVTPQSFSFVRPRQDLTCLRNSFMFAIVAYCCSRVEICSGSSKTMSD